jgi:predicted ester cyclase
MSLEENKAIIRKWVKTINLRDFTVLDEFIAPDYVDHTNQLRGMEDVRQFYIGAFKDFPDLQRTIEDIIAEGDKVWVHVKITGTSLAGKKIESEVVTIFRIVNRKIVEGRSIPQLVSKEKKLKIT